MRTGFSVVVGLAGLACLMFATAAQAEVVKGRVVTGDGRPVSGADVAPFWQFDNHEITPYFGVTTGEDGSFTLSWDFPGMARMFLVMNAERTLGGIVVLQPSPEGEDGTIDAGAITLVPMIEIQGDFYCDAFESPPEWSNVYMNVHPDIRLRIGSCPSDDAEFWFKLPPGEYQFHGYGRDFLRVMEDITLTAGDVVLDMGTIKVQPTIISQLYGKVPPKLTVTDARGLPKDFSLEDFRGKWTLLEAWGFW